MLDDLHMRAFGKPRGRAPSPTPMRINIPTVPQLPVTPRSGRPRPSPLRSRTSSSGNLAVPPRSASPSMRSHTPTSATRRSGRRSLGAPGSAGSVPPRSRSLSRGPPPRPELSSASSVRSSSGTANNTDAESLDLGKHHAVTASSRADLLLRSGGAGSGTGDDRSATSGRRRQYAGLSETTRRLLEKTNTLRDGGGDDVSVASNSSRRSMGSRRSMSSRRSKGSAKSGALDDILSRIDDAKSRLVRRSPSPSLAGSDKASRGNGGAADRTVSSPAPKSGGGDGSISSQIEMALMIEKLASAAVAVKNSDE